MRRRVAHFFRRLRQRGENSTVVTFVTSNVTCITNFSPGFVLSLNRGQVRLRPFRNCGVHEARVERRFSAAFASRRENRFRR